MVDTLANVPLFAGLDRTELAPLALVTVARSYAGNAIVVNEGDRADTGDRPAYAGRGDLLRRHDAG